MNAYDTGKDKEANDVKQLSLSECEQLAQEIRDFLIRSLSETGGHLASNLGVVELTIALHRFLHFPEDKLVWDVGHQAYTHKILTGRKEQFATLRKTGGLSGFPKRKKATVMRLIPGTVLLRYLQDWGWCRRET